MAKSKETALRELGVTDETTREELVEKLIDAYFELVKLKKAQAPKSPASRGTPDRGEPNRGRPGP